MQTTGQFTVLKSKANQIETPGSRQGGVAYDSASAALWASLTDKTGAGFDAKDDPEKEGGEIPLSPSSASSVLAEYLRTKGADATLDFQQVRELIDSPSAPVEVRAAAKYLRENPEVWTAVVGFGHYQATATKLDEFIMANRNLATVAGIYGRLDTAKQDSGKTGGTGDGKVTDGDIDAALQNKAGKFTPDELKALKWVLEHENELGINLRSGGSWTRALVHRQVFAENPKLAADYVGMASKNPDRFMYHETWFDTAGTRAWLRAATAATTDPKQRDKLVLQLVSIYQETKPPGPLAIVHDMLDWISYGDPTQAADGLNTAIYTAEGDHMNASLSAAGMLLPLAGGGALRLSRKAIYRLARNESDEVSEAVVKAILDGTLKQEALDKVVKDIAEQFDEPTAQAFKKNIDEAIEKASRKAGNLEGKTNYEVVDPAVTGHAITDIDLVENGVLWEQKTALNALDPEVWITKHIDGKVTKYLEARKYMPGYENAPIGFDFTRAGVDPGFRAAIETRVAQLRITNPGVEIKVRWQ